MPHTPPNSAAPLLQTELHRHLDVSIRLSTLLELAQAKGLEAASTSLAAFGEKILLTRPLQDLEQVLATFSLFQHVQDRPEVLERVAFEVVEDCYHEGTRQAELRFSPGFVTDKSGLSWDEVLDAYEAGLRRALIAYPDMKAGLICIGSRDRGPDSIARTVEFVLRHQSRFLGFDLAGNELGFPCRLYEAVTQPLRAAGTRITVHAGEAAGPENMWEAIALIGAQRIGHGVAAIHDPKLMDHLRVHGICLEICPTSNWLTQACATLSEHPLPLLLRAGVPVCINTDDPGVFDVTVPSEMAVAAKYMGLTNAELEQCTRHAMSATFIR